MDSGKSSRERVRTQLDLEQAREFLRLLFDTDKGQHHWQCFDDRRVDKAERARPQVFVGSFDQVAPHLKRLNRHGLGCFVAMNKLSDLEHRKTENVIGITAIVADLDGQPLEVLKRTRLKPHIIVESSKDRFHIYYKATGLSVADFPGVQRSIAAILDSDPAVDKVVHVCRMPGFWHRKGKPFQTRIIESNDHPAYTAEEALEEFQPRATPHKAPQSPKSRQSRPRVRLDDKDADNIDGKPSNVVPLFPNQQRAIIGDLAEQDPDKDPISFALKRSEAAKQLKVGVGVIDKAVSVAREAKPDRPHKIQPPLAHHPVHHPDHMLNELFNVFTRHVVMVNEANYVAAALWVVHSYAFDLFSHSPILFVSSPTKGCGKTQTMKVLSRLVARPMLAANMSTAAAMRSMNTHHPTLLLDEFDNVDLTIRAEYLAILNSGHEKCFAVAYRCVGETLEPTEFSVWAPKAFAAIKNIAPTLMDRSIIINMAKKLKTKTTSPIPVDLNTYDALRRDVARWVHDHPTALGEAKPEIPQALGDRQADNWRPLLAIADLAGGDWPKLARSAAVTLSDVEYDDLAVMLIVDLYKIFTDTSTQRPWLHSQTICDELKDMEDRPWAAYNRGKPIEPHHLAALLKPFKIAPKNVGPRNDQAKGYRREWFAALFKSYGVVEAADE